MATGADEPGRRGVAVKLADAPDVLTVEQAAALLAVGRTAAYQAIRAGEIPSVRVGRCIRVPRHALEQMLTAPGTDFPAKENGAGDNGAAQKGVLDPNGHFTSRGDKPQQNPYDRLDELADAEYPESWIPEEPGDTLTGEFVRLVSGTDREGKEHPIAVIRDREGHRAVAVAAALGPALRVQEAPAQDRRADPRPAAGRSEVGERSSLSRLQGCGRPRYGLVRLGHAPERARVRRRSPCRHWAAA